MADDGPAEEDTFKILVATDTHLGYNEKDPIRGDDSFIAFEEILRHAVDNSVDFILLGGDLFHDNKPSSTTIERCMALLRKYCLGDNPVCIEFLSDPSESFSHCEVPIVNYEDPNINVAFPVFTIHGNHDDPSGPKMQCALDLLTTVGLINHFGKWTDLTKVELKPLLLRKGRTFLSLYGLGHIKDQRLARLMRDDKVTFFRPNEDKNKWFNLLVLHQNRAVRGVNNFVQEDALPDFLDLVIWGHEHDCHITATQNMRNKVYITQPGSSVATSLSEGEAIPKHVGLLRIFQKKFNLQKIPLETVRPFIFDTLMLSATDLDPENEQISKKVEKLAEKRVEDMLEEALGQLSGRPEQPALPLIRLRIEFSTDRQLFNMVRFGQKFQGRVANPSDLILMRREPRDAKVKREDVLDTETFAEAMNKLRTREEISIYGIMEQYFADQSVKDNSRCMQMLSSVGMIEALKRYIRQNDKDAIECIIRYQTERTRQYLESVKDDDYEENFDVHIERFRQQRAARAEEEAVEISTQLNTARPDRTMSQRATPASRGRGRGSRKTAVALDDDDDISLIEPDSGDEANGSDHSLADVAPKSGKGSRGRGSRGPRGSRGGAGSRGTRSRGTAAASTSAADATADSQSRFEALFSSSRRSSRK